VTAEATIVGPPPSSHTMALADGWLAYGLHAGAMF